MVLVAHLPLLSAGGIEQTAGLSMLSHRDEQNIASQLRGSNLLSLHHAHPCHEIKDNSMLFHTISFGGDRV